MGGQTVMSVENDAIPAKDEVARQLERMLAEAIFKSHPKQAEVFAFIVRSELQGQEISEKSIRSAIFPHSPYEPFNNHVRVTVTHVRNRLQEYYCGPGIDDRVLIGLPTHKEHKPPPGEAYKPVFRYSSRGIGAEHYLRGIRHLGELSSRPNLGFALQAFEEAIETEPDYGPAHAAMAEAQLLQAFFTYDIAPETFLAEAESSAREALRLNEKLWQANTILAAVHACRWNWMDASAELEAAKEAAGAAAWPEAWDSPWRAAITMAQSVDHPAGGELLHFSVYFGSDNHRYLTANARVLNTRAPFALESMERRAKDRPGDVFAQCLYALFLHVAGDATIARVHASAQKDGDVGNWLLHVVNELADIASGRKRDWLWYPVPGYGVDYSPILKNDAFLRWSCPGLFAVFAAARGLDEEARQMLMEMQCCPYVRPFQFALACLAFGDHQGALRELLKAADERDPFILWLPLWPLFDPLRGYPEFKAVIERMDLPVRYQ